MWQTPGSGCLHLGRSVIQRHSALSTAGAAAETPVGLMKAYLGTRKQRAEMTVLELVTRLLGNGDVPGYLPQQAAQFGTCHQ